MSRSLEEMAAPATISFFRDHDALAQPRVREGNAYRAWLDAIEEVTRKTPRVQGLRLGGNTLLFIDETGTLTTVNARPLDGNGAERTVFAPPDGETIDYLVPSPTGAYALVGTVQNGWEAHRLRIVDTTTGAVVGSPIDGVRFRNARWLPGDEGLCYLIEPKEIRSSNPAEIYTRNRVFLRRVKANRQGHGVAAAVDDVPVFGFGMDGSSFVDVGTVHRVISDASSKWVVAISNHAIDDPFLVAIKRRKDLLDPSVPWQTVYTPADGVRDVILREDRLFVRTFHDSPLMRVDERALGAEGAGPASTLEKAEREPIISLSASGKRLFVTFHSVDGARLVARDFRTGTRTEIALPTGVSVTDLVASDTNDTTLLRLEGWTRPPAWFVVDGKDLRPVSTSVPAAHVDDVRVEHRDVSLEDGRTFDVTLVLPPSWRAPGPIILTAYGSYGDPHLATFKPDWQAWLARGGGFAVARIRGGGDYGQTWHAEAQRETKVRSVLDFIAAAETLTRTGVTTPSRLGLFGWSAGGVLVNGAIVRRPELFAAAVVDRGLANPVRLKYGANGPINTQEFGTPDTESGMRGLLELDPYSQVKNHVAYPAVLYTVGMQDSRLPPWHSAKMVKRLEASTTSGKPILLSVGWKEGHGLNSTTAERSRVAAQWYTFYEQNLDGLRPR